MSLDTTQRYTPAVASLWRVFGIAAGTRTCLLRSPHRLFRRHRVAGGGRAACSARSGSSRPAGPPNGAAHVRALLLVGVILWHVIYQAQIAVATGFLEETWSRSVLNLIAHPMREWEYVLGVASSVW
jgi:ABC-2 type transport system permease protein